MDENAGVIEIRFVGGPLHGKRTLMAHPEFKMVLGSPGEVIQYCRRMIEVAEIGGRRREIATYAPYGMPEEKFERLVIKAAKLDSGTTRRLSETRIRTGE